MLQHSGCYVSLLTGKYIIWSNEQGRNPNITKIIWLTKCHVSQYSGCHVLLLEAQHLLWARFEYYFIRLQIFLINICIVVTINIDLVIMCRNVLDILLLWVHGGPLQHGLPLHLLLGLPPRWHFKAFWFDLNCFFLWIISVVIWFKIIFKQMISVVIWFNLFQQMISVVIDLKMGLGSHTDARYEWAEDWGWKYLQQENIWIEDGNICNKKQQEQQQCCQMK